MIDHASNKKAKYTIDNIITKTTKEDFINPNAHSDDEICNEVTTHTPTKMKDKLPNEIDSKDKPAYYFQSKEEECNSYLLTII